MCLNEPRQAEAKVMLLALGGWGRLFEGKVAGVAWPKVWAPQLIAVWRVNLTEIKRDYASPPPGGLVD